MRTWSRLRQPCGPFARSTGGNDNENHEFRQGSPDAIVDVPGGRVLGHWIGASLGSILGRAGIDRSAAATVIELLQQIYSHNSIVTFGNS